jgi:hypothetical protein
MGRNLFIVTLLFCVVIVAGYLDIASGGTTSCVGQRGQFKVNDSASTIASGTMFTFRNVNDTQTINIDRIVVYNASGEVKCDYDKNTFPESFESSLLPHHSTEISTRNMPCIPHAALGEVGAIQTVITWSFQAGKFGEPLSVTSTLYYVYPSTFEAFGWSTVMCNSIAPK